MRKTAVLSARVDADTARRVDARAQELGKTRSQYVEDLVKKDLGNLKTLEAKKAREAEINEVMDLIRRLIPPNTKEIDVKEARYERLRKYVD